MDSEQISRHSQGPRVAFVDLLFCWPPKGGADVDLYHVVRGLHQRNIPVNLFVLHLEGAKGRGCIDSDAMPVPVAIVKVSKAQQNQAAIVDALRAAVDAWHPDIVFLTHGYALKAEVAIALSHYPLVGRYYAHELLCARDSYRFKDNAPCPYDYLTHPDHCRRCALESLGPKIKADADEAWIMDYWLAGAYTATYHQRLTTALSAMRAIIVYNESLQKEMGVYQSKTVIIPGGVDITKYNKKVSSGNTIVMTGRVEDPAKGLGVLLEACDFIAREACRPNVVISHFDPRFRYENVTATGWLTHEETRTLYETADICVVPSLWREPFGLTALEAMAAGLPVCASRTGGLKDSVVHEQTGLLFPPGNARALAQALKRLLDDASARRAMGAAGRDRVRTLFTWDQIIETCYLPLLESLIDD